MSLTLTWAATYTVDGGPVTDVPGATATDSPVSTLTIGSAESVLMDAFD